MISLYDIRTFLDSLRIDTNLNDFAEIRNLVTRINQLHTERRSSNAENKPEDDNKTKPEESEHNQEDSLRFKLIGFILAKIGDSFIEKYAK